MLAGDLELARFFEEAARGTASGKKIANWVINNISAVLNEKGMRPSECPVKPGAIRELIAIIDDGTVSNTQAKDVFAKMWDEPALAVDGSDKQVRPRGQLHERPAADGGLLRGAELQCLGLVADDLIERLDV